MTTLSIEESRIRSIRPARGRGLALAALRSHENRRASIPTVPKRARAARMFLFCSMRRTRYGLMSMPSLRRRPPEPDLSHPEPAGEFKPPAVDSVRRRGRGAQTNATGRYEPRATIAFDDGWQSIEELPPFTTEVAVDTARKVITRNNSPDISFDRSINPYRGCEHGCIYCFARPTHAYLGLSPGPRFRIQAVHEAGRAGTAGARTLGAQLHPAHHRHRHQYRSLSADRAPLPR